MRFEHTYYVLLIFIIFFVSLELEILTSFSRYLLKKLKLALKYIFYYIYDMDLTLKIGSVL